VRLWATVSGGGDAKIRRADFLDRHSAKVGGKLLTRLFGWRIRPDDNVIIFYVAVVEDGGITSIAIPAALATGIAGR